MTNWTGDWLTVEEIDEIAANLLPEAGDSGMVGAGSGG
jgi:hypothetical protein